MKKFAKSAIRLWWLHIRVGYVNALLVCDAVLIALGCIDVYRYAALGLSLNAAVFNSFSLVTRHLGEGVGIFLFFVFVFPVLIALTLLITGSGTRRSGTLGLRKRYFGLIHIVCSLFLAYSP